MQYNLLLGCLLISFSAQGMEPNRRRSFSRNTVFHDTGSDRLFERLSKYYEKLAGDVTVTWKDAQDPSILVDVENFASSVIIKKEEINKPPIFQAIENDDLEKVKELITDIDTFDSIEQKYQGNTPLGYATHYVNPTKWQFNTWRIAELLVNHGARVNCTAWYRSNDCYRSTFPLRDAVLNRNHNFVKFLLNKGADANRKNFNNETLLAEMANFLVTLRDHASYVATAFELIKGGASILEVNLSKKNFLQRIEGDIQGVNFSQAMSLLFEAFKWAIDHDVNRLKELCEANSPAIKSAVQWKDENGNTLLHVLAMSKPEGERIAKLDHLLHAGIDRSSNIANDAGETPRQLAIQNHDLPLSSLLANL